MKILIVGGSGGLGRACKEQLRLGNEVVTTSRSELDLENFEQIENFDLSSFDVVVNCVGANPGAYQGWQNNSWQNQVCQVQVNFTGALLLAKQYVKQRKRGQFVFVTSYNIEDPTAQNIFYTTSKAALRYSMKILRKEFPDFVFTEICPGKIRTNMLEQNYQGTKTKSEIDTMYNQTQCLDPNAVAAAIETSVRFKLLQITVTPNEQTSI